MTPIVRVHSVALTTPLTWPHLRAIVGCGHSRIPVHLSDDKTAIVGLLLVKELFAAIRLEDLQPAEGSAPRTIADAIKLRPIPKMNADTPLYTALNYFQTGRSHMAVVTRGKTVLYLDAHVSLVPPRQSTETSTSEAAPPRLVRARGSGAGASATSSPVLGAVESPAAEAAAPVPNSPIIINVHAATVPDASPATDEAEVLGILTLEDVLEELLQEEILDETDRAEGDEHVAQAANDLTLKEHLSPQRVSVTVPEGNGSRWDLQRIVGEDGGWTLRAGGADADAYERIPS